MYSNTASPESISMIMNTGLDHGLHGMKANLNRHPLVKPHQCLKCRHYMAAKSKIFLALQIAVYSGFSLKTKGLEEKGV